MNDEKAKFLFEHISKFLKKKSVLVIDDEDEKSKCAQNTKTSRSLLFPEPWKPKVLNRPLQWGINNIIVKPFTYNLFIEKLAGH